MNHQLESVQSYLLNLQEEISQKIQEFDPSIQVINDPWERPEGGGGITRVFENGEIFEKGGVNFSHVFGDNLPPSASLHRPELAGATFQAMGVSLVLHPSNPHIPTTHMNVRFFFAEKEDYDPIWWFGGGFDLTPFYPYKEDVIHWHQTAKEACNTNDFGVETYKKFKETCDQYFYLKHRNETRGVGGLFFDDLNEPNFDSCFELLQNIGNSFIPAYFPIVEKRKDTPFSQKEKDFQLYRRGRYVEFNLVFDRGTLFGLQSGGRTESILMSLPPICHWKYDFKPEQGSKEEKLYTYFLKPQNWLQL